jgi:hypothetical protein
MWQLGDDEDVLCKKQSFGLTATEPTYVRFTPGNENGKLVNDPVVVFTFPTVARTFYKGREFATEIDPDSSEGKEIKRLLKPKSKRMTRPFFETSFIQGEEVVVIGTAVPKDGYYRAEVRFSKEFNREHRKGVGNYIILFTEDCTEVWPNPPKSIYDN